MTQKLFTTVTAFALTIFFASARIDAAGIRITGPTVLHNGESYSLTVEATNVGLGGQHTDSVGWRLNSPSYLISWGISRPAPALDFFEGQPMFWEVLQLPNDPSGLVTQAYAGGPVDKEWSVVAQYEFTVDYGGTLPKSDMLTLTGTEFGDPDGNTQAHAVQGLSFTIVEVPEPATWLLVVSGLATARVLVRRCRKN